MCFVTVKPVFWIFFLFFFFLIRNSFDTLKHMISLIAFGFIPVLFWSRAKTLIPFHNPLIKKGDLSKVQREVLWHDSPCF